MPDVCALNQFGFLKIQGIDAVKFLQGYTTNDLAALDESTVQLGAICNLQGRMVTSFLAIKDGHDLILRMDRNLVPVTSAFLAKYIVFSKAELRDISDELACFGVRGTFGAFTLQKANDGYLIGLGNREEQWLPAATTLDADPGDGEFSSAEFESGIAWIRPATSEEFLPQMFNYHTLSGVDFTKGCYLGQEIVARAQYRGELKRRLHRLPLLASVNVGDRIGGQGMVVATSPAGMLAVLQNASEEDIEIEVSGHSLLAQAC